MLGGGSIRSKNGEGGFLAVGNYLFYISTGSAAKQEVIQLAEISINPIKSWGHRSLVIGESLCMENLECTNEVL